MTVADFVTIIRCQPGKRLAKLYRDPATEPDGYDGGFLFQAEARPVSSLDDFLAVVRDVQRDPRACIIRGAVHPDVQPGEWVRRLSEAKPEDGAEAAFSEAPHHWAMLDDDHSTVPYDPANVEGSLERAAAELPADLQSAQLAFIPSAKSHLSKTVRGKWIVWFDRPVGEAELR